MKCDRCGQAIKGRYAATTRTTGGTRIVKHYCDGCSQYLGQQRQEWTHAGKRVTYSDIMRTEAGIR